MNYKHKNIALIFGFIVVLALCYRFAISKTIAQKQQYSVLYQQEELFRKSPKQISLLKQKNRYYDSILHKNQLGESSIQHSLLKTITTVSKANNITIIAFLEPHLNHKNNLTVKTYEFIVQGQYNQINQLIYQLEQHTKYGEIIHLHFEKKKNIKSGKYYLQARVLLRSFG